MSVMEAPVDFAIPKYEFEPEHIGKVWERHPLTGKFILPEKTLGYQIVTWCEQNLKGPGGGAWSFTPEQYRIVLWWYAVDDRGRWLFRDGILQRIKGWGKDPFAAVLALVELVGPCRFKGWAADDYPALGISKGDPVGKDNPQAWIQIAAVSGSQTKNTMLCFPWLVDEQFKQKYRLNIGKEIIYAYGGARRIEAVTSNPRALEGGRPSFMIRNETHHWIETNDGHEMADVIERNLTKSSDGSARALSITNAYSPHESSVAQKQRESYEAEASGAAISTGVYYDSLEAPSTFSLVPPRPDEIKDEKYNELYGEMTKAWLGAMVRAVRGDSHWLDVERIVLSMLDGNRSVSTSKRFWLNVVTTTEDAWVDPAAITAAIHPFATENKNFDSDHLRFGWSLVMPDEEIVMFGDGSKSQDSTALVGVRVSDGYSFLIGVWQKPAGKRGDNWLAPRTAVDARVREAFARFNVVGFWFDPSHAKDDEDSSRYWDTLCDEWMRDFGDRLVTWSTKSGHRKHAVMFDMTSPERVALFTSAAEMTVEELERKNDIEEFAPAFQIDGHPVLVDHMRNARKYPTTWGESLGKENRSSLKKVDAAVCLVGGQLLRRLHLNATFDDPDDRDGGLWGW